MNDGKWIQGLSPSVPAAVAARQVLTVRCAAVRQTLPRAVEQGMTDVEAVHDLRVATRRAAAALRVFQTVLPKRLSNAARKHLRQLRRAAGDARDWDVFLLRLPQAKPLQRPSGHAAADFLHGYGLALRRQAQTQLQLAAAEHGPAFAEAVDKLLDHLRSDNSGPPLRVLAQEQTAELFHIFQEALHAQPATPEQLHQLRIHGKRLRYAVEIFMVCFPPWFEQRLYPVLAQLQELLGHYQDAVVGMARLKELNEFLRQRLPERLARLAPGLNGWSQSLRAQLPALRKSFRQWLEQWPPLAERTIQFINDKVAKSND